jgi:hypothetical protein
MSEAGSQKSEVGIQRSDLGPRTSDLRPSWLIVGFALGLAYLALAGPIGGLSDWLAASLGVKAYWRLIHRVETGCAVAGLPLAAWLLWCARARLDTLFPGLVALACATVSFNLWLMTSAVEPIHYPQYALLGLVLRVGTGSDFKAALIGFFFGALDEYLQGFVDRRTDLADVEYNFVAVLWGVWLWHLLQGARE